METLLFRSACLNASTFRHTCPSLYPIILQPPVPVHHPLSLKWLHFHKAPFPPVCSYSHEATEIICTATDPPRTDDGHCDPIHRAGNRSPSRAGRKEIEQTSGAATAARNSRRRLMKTMKRKLNKGRKIHRHLTFILQLQAPRSTYTGGGRSGARMAVGLCKRYARWPRTPSSVTTPWVFSQDLGFFNSTLDFFKTLRFFLGYWNPFCSVVSTAIVTNSLATYQFIKQTM